MSYIVWFTFLRAMMEIVEGSLLSENYMIIAMANIAITCFIVFKDFFKEREVSVFIKQSYLFQL